MPTILLLIVLIIVVALLAKSFHDAQRQSTTPRPRTRSAPRPRMPRPRPRRQAKPIDQAKLAEHVKKLRSAVDADLISREEAVASIIRHTDGQLSEEAAAALLRSHDAA
jgi:hypothetical protein